MEQINEINIPEIEEKPQKNNKKALVIILSCFTAFVVVITVGIFIVRAYNSDERKLIKGFQNLAMEINERQQLWKKASVDMSADGYGTMKMTTTLNLSGDGLPITIGIDTTTLRDGGAHRIRTSTALSVMNNELLELIFYGDDDKLMFSVPDLWRQNLEITPENIDIQYNTSLLAEKFGQIESSGISIELFPEKDNISWSENFKLLLEEIIDIFQSKKKDSEDSVTKISVEKLEETIVIGIFNKDDRSEGAIKSDEADKQYECSIYRMIIPKEWIESMQPDNGLTIGMQTADVTLDAIRDVTFLVFMEKNGRIIRISSEEPLQFRMKYEDIEEAAEIMWNLYFLGEERSIDNIAVSMEAEITTDSLMRKERGIFGADNSFHGEEKQRLQLEAEIKYDKDGAQTTIDISELSVFVDNDAASRVTGEIAIEPLKEEILPLDGETIQLFKITEDEYEDLQNQLQKKLLKWLAILSLME